MRRWLLGGFFLLAVLAAADLVIAWARGTRPVVSALGSVGSRPPILVGLIHSQTGPLAISERSLVDAEVLALEEINAKGGVAGFALKWEIADGRSDPTAFADQARRLIEKEGAKALFGGWTAECRKAMVAVVEEEKSLLVFPSNFEGIESSPNVIYSGGSANQVILPSVRWCVDALKAGRFYVVATEEIWSRVVAEMAKDGIKAAGAELVGESYPPLAGGDADEVVAAVRAARPDVVLNLIVGDFNLPFFASLRRSGATAEKLPVVSFSIAEDELKRFPPGDATGHYAGWSYFQGLERPENLEFVRRFKARYGENRAVSDAMVAAYNGVRIWAQAADEAGKGEPEAVLALVDRQSVDAPEGIVSIEAGTHVAWRPFYLGRARADGQFDVVWSITKPIQPLIIAATRSKERWRALLAEFKGRWGGRWSSSEPSRPAPGNPPR